MDRGGKGRGRERRGGERREGEGRGGEGRGKLKSHSNSTRLIIFTSFLLEQDNSPSVQTIFSPTLEIFTFKIYINTRFKDLKIFS